MKTPPPKPLLKWGEMVEWLMANGLKKTEVLAFYRAGKIRPHVLPPSRVKHYWPKEIKKEILDGIKGKG